MCTVVVGVQSYDFDLQLDVSPITAAVDVPAAAAPYSHTGAWENHDQDGARGAGDLKSGPDMGAAGFARSSFANTSKFFAGQLPSTRGSIRSKVCVCVSVCVRVELQLTASL